MNQDPARHFPDFILQSLLLVSSGFGYVHLLPSSVHEIMVTCLSAVVHHRPVIYGPKHTDIVVSDALAAERAAIH